MSNGHIMDCEGKIKLVIQDKKIYQDIISYLLKVKEECKYLLNFCRAKDQVDLLDKSSLLRFIYSKGIHEIVTNKGTYFFQEYSKVFLNNEYSMEDIQKFLR